MLSVLAAGVSADRVTRRGVGGRASRFGNFLDFGVVGYVGTW